MSIKIITPEELKGIKRALKNGAKKIDIIAEYHICCATINKIEAGTYVMREPRDKPSESEQNAKFKKQWDYLHNRYGTNLRKE